MPNRLICTALLHNSQPWRSGRNAKISKFWWLLIWPATLWSQAVWIVEKPGALRILNEFEQTLPIATLDRLPDYWPVEVIEWNHVLGDGFTRAVRVRYDSRSYFFQRDAGGQLMGAGSSGLITNADVWRIADTMQVISADGATLQTWPTGNRVIIPKDEKIERLWGWADRCFVKRLATGDAGWILFPETPAVWQKHRSSAPVRRVSVDVLVQPIVDSINAASFRVTAAFNRVENQSIVPAQWRLEQLTAERWTVSPSSTSVRRTTQELAGRIRTALLGSNASVTVAGDLIEIRLP